MIRRRAPRIAVAALGTVVVLGAGVLAAPSAVAATTSRNLIVNGNAEAGLGSPVPNWRLSRGTTFESQAYGQGGFPELTDPGPTNRGANLFAGGQDEAREVAVQSRPLTAYTAAIDAGTATYNLTGWLGGYSDQGDSATLAVTFSDAAGAALGTATIGPVTARQRHDATGLLLRTATGAVPVGARKVLVQLTLRRTDGTYNDGYADNLSLTITTP